MLEKVISIVHEARRRRVSQRHTHPCQRQALRLIQQLFVRSCDFRRMGAAALDLCAVACGRVEAFFEYSLCPWDYAAGSLLVEEAGGAEGRDDAYRPSVQRMDQ